MSGRPELSVVMPVYNEAAGMPAVVAAWTSMLDGVVGSEAGAYELRLYNDGSKDDTPRVLDDLAAKYGSVRVVHQSNRGHGPTVLRGYREAIGNWVFQVDSDDEIPAEMFERVWSLRDGHDAVFGIRHDRQSPWLRRLMTTGSRLAVRLLFGRGPTDVNVPFRLIRRSVLTDLARQLPDHLFAPNVAMSGLVARERVKFVEVPVMTQDRRTGTTSLAGAGRLAGVAWRVIRETMDVASRRSRRPE